MLVCMMQPSDPIETMHVFSDKFIDVSAITIARAPAPVLFAHPRLARGMGSGGSGRNPNPVFVRDAQDASRFEALTLSSQQLEAVQFVAQ